MRIEKERNNEGENDENEIDVERNATSDDGDETIKNNHYFKSPYQS